MTSKQKKKSLINEENKKEIFYNSINSVLAGSLVFFGALLNGGFDIKAVIIAIITAAITAIVKFKDYWDGEKSEYCKGLMNFV